MEGIRISMSQKITIKINKIYVDNGKEEKNTIDFCIIP
jgi:hypothetical protein